MDRPDEDREKLLAVLTRAWFEARWPAVAWSTRRPEEIRIAQKAARRLLDGNEPRNAADRAALRILESSGTLDRIAPKPRT